MVKKKTSEDIIAYWEKRGSSAFVFQGEIYYTITSLPLYLKRRKLLLNLVEPIIQRIAENSVTSINVLDFGCGDGYYSCWLKEKFDHINVFGCDLSVKMIEMAKSRANSKNINIKYKVSDSSIPFSGKFDIIIVNAVLAHVIDSNNLLLILKNMKDHLNFNGIILIYESTSEIPRQGSTWHRRTQKQYEEYFIKVGLKTSYKNTLYFPIFNSLDKINRKIFKKMFSLFNKKDYLNNLNQSNSYLFTSRLILGVSIIFGIFYKSSDGNTLFVLTKE